MSESKHTPGPWGLDYNPKQEQLPTIYAGHDLVPADEPLAPYVDIAEVRQPHTYSEAMANARLIAAAPDLLEACREALRWYYSDDADRLGQGSEEDRRISALLRAALNKAEGPDDDPFAEEEPPAVDDGPFGDPWETDRPAVGREEDYGGAFDGHTVHSDADPGL